MLRTCLVAAVGFVPLLFSGEASAYDDKVRKHCRADYMAHCSQHDLGSAGLRACMRKVGPKLSPACISALMDSGEVSASAVQHRRVEGR